MMSYIFKFIYAYSNQIVIFPLIAEILVIIAILIIRDLFIPKMIKNAIAKDDLEKTIRYSRFYYLWEKIFSLHKDELQNIENTAKYYHSQYWCKKSIDVEEE